MAESNKKAARRIFFYVAGAILLYWMLNETDRVRGFFQSVSDIFAPFIFGGILAFILNVPMRVIEGRLLRKIANQGLKRVFAVLLTFLCLLLVLLRL